MIDLVLVFLLFEKVFYDKFDMFCCFIGYMMVDVIVLKFNWIEVCEKFGLDESKCYVVILIGSCGSEI